jgi:hypothetical protein
MQALLLHLLGSGLTMNRLARTPQLGSHTPRPIGGAFQLQCSNAMLAGKLRRRRWTGLVGQA